MSAQYYGDPSEAYYRWDADQAEAQERFEKACPICQLCGEPITDEHCYCLTASADKEDRYLSCVHSTCIKVRPMGSSDRLNELLKWLVEDLCYTRTPFKEETNG